MFSILRKIVRLAIPKSKPKFTPRYQKYSLKTIPEETAYPGVTGLHFNLFMGGDDTGFRK